MSKAGNGRKNTIVNAFLGLALISCLSIISTESNAINLQVKNHSGGRLAGVVKWMCLVGKTGSEIEYSGQFQFFLPQSASMTGEACVSRNHSSAMKIRGRVYEKDATGRVKTGVKCEVKHSLNVGETYGSKYGTGIGSGPTLTKTNNSWSCR